MAFFVPPKQDFYVVEKMSERSSSNGCGSVVWLRSSSLNSVSGSIADGRRKPLIFRRRLSEGFLCEFSATVLLLFIYSFSYPHLLSYPLKTSVLRGSRSPPRSAMKELIDRAPVVQSTSIRTHPLAGVSLLAGIISIRSECAGREVWGVGGDW